MQLDRYRHNLSGIWDLCSGDGRPSEDWRPAAVPGTVNVVFPDLAYHQGDLWYRRTVEVPPPPGAGFSWRLVFLGANYRTEAFLEHMSLGSHLGGFTPFAFPWPSEATGSHELLVRVNTAMERTRVPHLDYDWFNYGGLYRPVFLEAVPPVSFDGMQAVTLRNGERFDLRIHTAVQRREGHGEGVEITARLYDGSTEMAFVSKSLDLSEVMDHAEVSINDLDVRAWELGSPHLYLLRVTLFQNGEEMDRASLHVGFREVTVQDGLVLLNGKPVRLLGVGKHDEQFSAGRTLTLAQYQKDLELMRRAHINAFRTSHYAPSEDVVDLADRMGIGVILEGAPFFHTGSRKEKLYAQFSDEEAVRDGTAQLEEAVRTFRNHPSVLFWSIGNEMGTDRDGAREFVAGRVAAVRNLDHTRPVGFSGMAIQPASGVIGERCIDLVDYIDVHLYAGWYEENEYGTVEQALSLLDDLHGRWPKKPILIGEFGADGIMGCRSLELAKWSEDYQEFLLTRLIQEYAGRSFVSGLFVWHLFDFRTLPQRALRRPREFNHKGILDENRRPKLAYGAVARLFGRLARGEDIRPDGHENGH
ncbi:MAG: glycoside hydrolase family 2 TIM barrel-domain containing protein [Bacilli bacterium]